MPHIRHMLLALAFLVPSVASGVVLFVLDDPQKERAIADVQKDAKTQALRLEFDALAHRMWCWKSRDFEALFGPPIRPVQKDYAMTCTQSRMVLRGGVGLFGDDESKAHTDAFDIGAGLRADVEFQRDGVTPCCTIFHLRIAEGFVRLDKADQLEARVAWERTILSKALKHVDDRWKAVVQWEVDRTELGKLYTGRDAIDPAEKLQAYLAWGEKRGLELSKTEGQWPWMEWRGKDGREARAYGNNTEVTNFVLFDADGRSVVDHLGGPRSYFIRWNRPDGSSSRFESWERDGEQGTWRAVKWVWTAPGARAGRHEEDTNGDGIPDQVSEGDRVPFGPLKIEESWAVHPELIPEAMRVAGQPNRRLPIRRIAK